MIWGVSHWRRWRAKPLRPPPESAIFGPRPETGDEGRSIGASFFCVRQFSEDPPVSIAHVGKAGHLKTAVTDVVSSGEARLVIDVATLSSPARRPSMKFEVAWKPPGTTFNLHGQLQLATLTLQAGAGRGDQTSFPGPPDHTNIHFRPSGWAWHRYRTKVPNRKDDGDQRAKAACKDPCRNKFRNPIFRIRLEAPHYTYPQTATHPDFI